MSNMFSPSLPPPLSLSPPSLSTFSLSTFSLSPPSLSFLCYSRIIQFLNQFNAWYWWMFQEKFKQALSCGLSQKCNFQCCKFYENNLKNEIHFGTSWRRVKKILCTWETFFNSPKIFNFRSSVVFKSFCLSYFFFLMKG